MVCLWLGVGAAIGVTALFLGAAVLNSIDQRARARNAAIRQRRNDAETAMVRTVQNSTAEMFDAVRRRP